MARRIETVQQLLDLPEGSILYIELSAKGVRFVELAFAMRNDCESAVYSARAVEADLPSVHCKFAESYVSSPHEILIAKDEQLQTQIAQMAGKDQCSRWGICLGMGKIPLL